MATAIFIIAAAVSTAPILAIVLVSAASRREDRAGSLTSTPPDPASALARRILGFRSEGTQRQQNQRLSRSITQQARGDADGDGTTR